MHILIGRDGFLIEISDRRPNDKHCATFLRPCSQTLGHDRPFPIQPGPSLRTDTAILLSYNAVNHKTIFHTSTYANRRSHWPHGLRPLACWDCGFESHGRHGYLSIVSVVCCQVEVSATS